MERREEETAEEYLERIPSFAREKSDLRTVREFLGLLGNPDRGMEIIHVAGTNGKGSVCAFLTAILREAGIFVGTFTSPHLVDIKERFSINGRMISEEQFASAFGAVEEAVRKWMQKGGLHPTYFEFLFYMGLFLFKEAKVRVLILETGMGGLKDVTNVIEHPLVSVISSISVEHTAFLGNTIPKIAAHKAGIIKRGCPVVYDSSVKDAETVIVNTAREKESPWFPVGNIPFFYENERLLAELEYLGSTAGYQVPFPAPYQAENAALAVKAIEVSGFKLDREIVAEGLKRTVWPARMEQILPGIYLDGAHNEDGIRAFLTAACLLKKERKPDKTWILFSVSSDKEYERMLKEIGERLQPDICLLSGMESGRALLTDMLFGAADKAMGSGTEIHCFDTMDGALDRMLTAKGSNDLVFITGSLYLAGEVKEKIQPFMEENT